MEKHSFSKKHPVKTKFIEKQDEASKAALKNSFSKIKEYNRILKMTDLKDELKSDLKKAIQLHRTKLKEETPIKKILQLSYKGIKVESEIDPKKSKKDSFLDAKKKLAQELKSRRLSNRNMPSYKKEVDGYQVTLVGGVHQVKGTMIEALAKIDWSRIRSYRKPTDSENNVGVEFEFFCPIDDEKVLASRFIQAKLARYVRIKTDRSIRPAGDTTGWEINVVMPESQAATILRRVCDILDDVEADVNPSCGLHVHLDARNRNREMLFNNLVSCQDLLYKLAHPSRMTNQFCQRQNSKDWNNCMTGHYAAISRSSYDQHKTIEVRIHEGTVLFDETWNWVKLLMKIANYNNPISKTVKDLKGFTEFFRDDFDLEKYIRSKVKVVSERNERVA